MDTTGSVSRRRQGVVVNYVFLLLTLLFGVIGEWSSWPSWVIAGFWLFMLLVIVSFVPVHIRSGLWRLSHASVGNLDERESQQGLESLRRSYTVYSIVSLLVILLLVVFNVAGRLPG